MRVALLVLLAASPVSAKPPALELKEGIVVPVNGGPVEVQQGDCYLPSRRCVAYAREFERCKTERDTLKAAPPPHPLLVVGVALVALATGAAVGRLTK